MCLSLYLDVRPCPTLCDFTMCGAEILVVTATQSNYSRPSTPLLVDRMGHFVKTGLILSQLEGLGVILLLLSHCNP